MKSIVVAMDRNNAIGADNSLLWGRDLPADLAYFKSLTMGGSIIMGRHTFESIGRPLPGRENIVVSRSLRAVAGICVARSLQQAYDTATRDKIFVIGGGQIYAQAMRDMDALHVTQVDAQFPRATVFFPEIDDQQWTVFNREHHTADTYNKYDYEFVEYRPTQQSAP
jgi:dihydrofolate reductase